MDLPKALGLSALVTLLSVGIFAGCDDNDDGAKTQTVTVSESTTDEELAPEDDGQAAADGPAENPVSRAEKTEAVVKRYYAAVDAANFRAAWELLSPSLQGELGGYSAWKEGYANTVSTKASDIHATRVTSAAATVALKLSATDVDVCGDTVDQAFAGSWTLTSTRGRWLGSGFDVAKTGGGTPVTDVSSCGGDGGEGSAPLTPAGCDPNYTGCVPPYPPDVDCIDVRQEVEVVGEDVHRLDLAGDGQACEIYFK